MSKLNREANFEATSSPLACVILPKTLETSAESEVKSLEGRILLGTGKEPDWKSVESRAIAYVSRISLLVIIQRIKSSPSSSATTKAGRRFEPDRSENGMTTTSPLTGLPKRHLPPVETNPRQVWLQREVPLNDEEELISA